MVAEAEKSSALTIAASEGSFKKITIAELNNLGYEITGRQMPVGTRPCKYGLMEVKEEGSKHIMSFCYIFSLESQTGIIVPRPFNEFIKAKKK